MPPERWMIALSRQPESLGEALKRLRLARGWSQEQVEEQTGISQTRLSAYERDAYAPKGATLRQLNDLYELPDRALADIARRHEEWREANPDRLPGDGVAIPQEPELVEAVRALYLLEDDELALIPEWVRNTVRNRQERPQRQQQRRERQQDAG